MQHIFIGFLLFISINAFAETQDLPELPQQDLKGSQYFFVESISEFSADANIYGVQTGLFSTNELDALNIYAGLGFYSVDLLRKNYEFNSIRAFIGVSPSWKIAPYAEMGFDLLEEIFNACNESDDNYCSTDPSFALGVRWQLNSQLMLNAYHKWYRFDGAILDTTYVNVTGISLGARF